MADYTNASEISVVYDGKDISRLVESVTLSGDTQRAARSLSVSLINTTDGRKRAFVIEEGKELTFSNNGEELFRGVVFSDDISSDGRQTVTAYDENVYLAKNYITRKLVKQTASAILTSLCGEFGISVGSVAGTGFVIPKLVARNKPAYEVIREALDITYKQNGRKFYLTNEGGKVSLVERSSNTVSFSLENAKNILGASYSKSIEDTKTQVKVIAGDVEDGITKVELEKAGGVASLYGTMQHIEEVSTEMTKSEMKRRAQELLAQLSTIKDDASIEALGDNRIKSGVQLNVKEEMTGLVGTYYVISDTHHFQGGAHTMSLTIAANDA